MKNLLLPKPLKIRKNIPFFCDKTEADFRQDKYENYTEVVRRQIRLHLAEPKWTAYPFTPILDWVFAQINPLSPSKIVDIGCGVGRLIGELAMQHPNSECWGMDYSYQLLRQAQDYWIANKTLHLNDAARGFSPIELSGKNLQNIHFGLAKGEALPFENQVIDLICSTFTLDRFDDPILALQEIYRVLKPNGQALIISPLNFQKEKHWLQFFPLERLFTQIQHIGFSIERIEEEIEVFEPLDLRNNGISWRCLGLVLRKSNA